MSISERRQRERAARHKAIIAAAREISEAEGWEAVTTRRLAEQVEYSQPVLYGHFPNKAAIIAAVAIDGFEQLAKNLRAAREAKPEALNALLAVGRAYLEFAATRPALYAAMFVMPIDVKFASERTPPQLRAGFQQLVLALRPYDAKPETRAELLWSALHGMAELARNRRIPEERQEARLNLLVAMIAADRN